MTKKQKKQLTVIAILLLIVYVIYNMLKGKDRQIMPDAFTGTGNDPMPYDDYSLGFDPGDSGVNNNGGLIDPLFDPVGTDGNNPMPYSACCSIDALSYDASCISDPYCDCDVTQCMYPDDSNSNYGSRTY